MSFCNLYYFLSIKNIYSFYSFGFNNLSTCTYFISVSCQGNIYIKIYIYFLLQFNSNSIQNSNLLVVFLIMFVYVMSAIA